MSAALTATSRCMKKVVAVCVRSPVRKKGCKPLVGGLTLRLDRAHAEAPKVRAFPPLPQTGAPSLIQNTCKLKYLVE